MSSIQELSSLFNNFNPSQNSQYLSASSAYASFEEGQSKDLTIVTKEGDRVTLSANSYSLAQFSTYNARGSIDGRDTEISGATTITINSSRFNLSVEGDLNEQELNEISKVVDSINKVTNQLFDGNTDEALGTALELTNLSSLQSVDARVEAYRKVSLGYAQITTNGPTPSNNSRSTLPSDATSSDQVQSRTPESHSKTLDSLSQLIKDSGIDVDKFLRPLNSLFKDLFDRLSDQEGRSHSRHHQGNKHHERLGRAHDFRDGLFTRLGLLEE